jgi:spermidine/putrescine transport system permease protein
VSAVASRTESGSLEAMAGPLRPGRRRWTAWILPTYVGLVIFYLVSPILVMVLYGFNATPRARVTFAFQGFTLRWYRELFGIPGLTDALRTSLALAALTTLMATALGTLMALALVRYRFRGRAVTESVMFLNISAPEIVMGSSLLALFVTLQVSRGFLTLLIAHVMFSVAYVVITVRARLIGYNRAMEEAAQDLGANAWQTFRLVTLPIIYPGILAGALMAFALSIDDFVISSFVAGQKTTFPLWVWGAVRVGIPPQVFVMGTLIFTGGVVLAITNLLLQRDKT